MGLKRSGNARLAVTTVVIVALVALSYGVSSLGVRRPLRFQLTSGPGGALSVTTALYSSYPTCSGTATAHPTTTLTTGTTRCLAVTVRNPLSVAITLTSLIMTVTSFTPVATNPSYPACSVTTVTPPSFASTLARTATVAATRGTKTYTRPLTLTDRGYDQENCVNGTFHFSYSVTATYTDSTTTTLETAPNPQTSGKAVTLTVKVTGSNSSVDTRTPTGLVDFYLFTPACTTRDAGTFASAEASNGSAHLSTTSLPAGTDCIQAVYRGTGSSFSGSASDIVHEQVGHPLSGYDLVGSDGGVFVFDAPRQTGGFYGSLPGIGVVPNKPVVGMVPTSDDRGYFLVAADGGVFSFGNAPFLGSLPGIGVVPNCPITGIIAANADRGYFLVGCDGGVFAFGTVPFLGSLPGEGVSVENIIGIASTPKGTGYWVVSATGTVYAFGRARQLGTARGTSSPVSAIAGTPTGGGYWITTEDGAVHAFGNARSFGTLPGIGVTPNLPVIGIVPTTGTGGYWLFGADGGIFAFGDAPFTGSLPGIGVHVTDIVGAVPN